MQQQGKIITTTAYTWSSNDILGRGAFGQVYKGIDRVCPISEKFNKKLNN